MLDSLLNIYVELMSAPFYGVTIFMIDNEQNTKIFNAVQQFIVKSNRLI